MYRKLLCIAVLALVGAQVAVNTVCLEDTECEPDECCQIMSQFPVASKRQLLPPPEPTGTCEKYQLEGSQCNDYDKLNGYCSCGPGLHCYLRLEPQEASRATVPDNKRGLPVPPTGYTWFPTCEKV